MTGCGMPAGASSTNTLVLGRSGKPSSAGVGIFFAIVEALRIGHSERDSNPSPDTMRSALTAALNCRLVKRW